MARSNKTALLSIICLLGSGVAFQASALTINVTGASDPNGIPVSGTAVFSFTQNGANSIYLDMVVTNNNTSATASALGGVLLAFNPNLDLASPGGLGYSRDPDGDSILSVFEQALFQQGDGGYLFDIDFCATAGQNCNGVSPNGLAEGQTDDGFRFILTFNSPFTAADLESWMSGTLANHTFGLCMRWQAVNSASVTGDSAKGCVMEYVPPDENVPEPGTLALLGLGLVGLAASRRRRTN